MSSTESAVAPLTSGSYKCVIPLVIMVFLILFQIGMERGLNIKLSVYITIFVIAGYFGLSMLAFGTELFSDISTTKFFKPVGILTGVSVLLMILSYFARDWLET